MTKTLILSWLLRRSRFSMIFSSSCSWRMARRAVRLVFMLVVMVTSLSLGGVARRSSLSTGTASASWSETFRHSLTHLKSEEEMLVTLTRISILSHLARLSA